MTNLEKLTELLCTVPEIEKEQKELRFGCKIKMFDSTMYWVDSDYGRYICVDQHFLYQDNPEWSLFEPEKEQDYKIIWNPIQERNLRMYIMQLTFNDNHWEEYDDFEDSKEWYYKNRKLVMRNNITDILDNTKDLQDQTEETLWKILYFLTK